MTKQKEIEEGMEKIARLLSVFYGFDEGWWDRAILWAADMKPMFLKRADSVLKLIDKLGYCKIEGKLPLLSDDIKGCLDCARGAIEDAICCEDGLDGGTGKTVIKWITDILGDYDEWIKTHLDK
ncbi:hypothetical protein ES703_47122 [subsurface metagenome]